MHLSKECVEDESSKRLFNLSANNKRGEFLGLENIFALDEASESCKTRDILKVRFIIYLYSLNCL